MNDDCRLRRNFSFLTTKGTEITKDHGGLFLNQQLYIHSKHSSTHQFINSSIPFCFRQFLFQYNAVGYEGLGVAAVADDVTDDGGGDRCVLR